ncbi:MAG: hypothetical protein ACK5LY_00820 [Lachnospirales bacterium]
MNPLLINFISIALGVLAIIAPLFAIYKNKFVFLLASISAILCSLVLYAQIYLIKTLAELGNLVDIMDKTNFIFNITGLFIFVVVLLNIISFIFNKIKKEK